MNLVMVSVLVLLMSYLSFLAFRTNQIMFALERCFNIDEEEIFSILMNVDSMPKLDHLIKEVKIQQEVITEEHRVDFTLFHNVQHVGLMKSNGVLRINAENLKISTILASFYGLVQSLSEYELTWDAQNKCTLVRERFLVNCPSVLSGFINRTVTLSAHQKFDTLQILLEDKTMNWRKQLLDEPG